LVKETEIDIDNHNGSSVYSYCGMQQPATFGSTLTLTGNGFLMAIVRLVDLQAKYLVFFGQSCFLFLIFSQVSVLLPPLSLGTGTTTLFMQS